MVMTPKELQTLLEDKIPDSVVKVIDLTGTYDHYGVDITSPAFVGKSLLDQHKMVHAAVGMHLTTTIHALQIKTRVPEDGAAGTGD